jgi:Domain of unknown function (DUF4397)
MKAKFALLAIAFFLGSLSTQVFGVARVQVIHNCADAAAASVDIYTTVSGASSLSFDNVAFRTATPYVDLPDGVAITIGIAPGNSMGVMDVIASFTVTLTANETYVVTASGIVSPSGYNPAQPFDLKIFAGAREAAANGTTTDVLVLHGATDAPRVEVAEVSVPAGVLIDSLSYGNYAGILSLPTADYSLAVRDDASGATVVTYSAPLNSLNLGGASIVVLASGFLTPANNSNGAPFGLWVALPAGGALVELPLITRIAEPSIFSGVSIAPNPSQGRFQARVELSRASTLSWTVRDFQGRSLRSADLGTVGAGTQEINADLHDLAVGTYLLEIQAGEQRSTRQINIVQ